MKKEKYTVPNKALHGDRTVKVKIIIFIAIFLLPNMVIASEPYDFVSDVIRSFESSYIAGERIKNTENDSFITLMKDIMIFNNEIKRAISYIHPYLSSKNALIKETAENYYFIYSSVIENNEKLLSFFEKVLNNPNDFSSKEGTFVRKFSELIAANEEIWRSLLHVTSLSTYTLVDQNRAEEGNLRFLTINSQERKNLIEQLERIFSDKIKNGPKAGLFPIEGSAALLWTFLNKGWKPSDSK